MIPSIDILEIALGAINPQGVMYYSFLSRTANAIGNDIATYSAPVLLNGSVQPVPRSAYQNSGLEFQKNYVNFFVSKNAIDIQRDVSGDYFIYDGKKYQCVSKTDWYSQDGWVQILSVETD
jgi:hypothetical protein